MLLRGVNPPPRDDSGTWHPNLGHDVLGPPDDRARAVQRCLVARAVGAQRVEHDERWKEPPASLARCAPLQQAGLHRSGSASPRSRRVRKQPLVPRATPHGRRDTRLSQQRAPGGSSSSVRASGRAVPQRDRRERARTRGLTGKLQCESSTTRRPLLPQSCLRAARKLQRQWRAQPVISSQRIKACTDELWTSLYTYRHRIAKFKQQHNRKSKRQNNTRCKIKS